MPVPVGLGAISSQDPPLRVVFLLGEEPPTVTGGYGGWEQVERPHRLPLTIWKGAPPYQMTVSLVLDGHARGGRSVAPQIKALERMGRVPGGSDPPPVVRVALPGSQPRASNVDWVLETIEWGAALRAKNGDKTRQFATLNLLQFTEDERLQELPPAKKRKKARTRTYTVKKGDTLKRIAAKLLGSGKRWTEIAKLNKIRDGGRLKVGRKLKIPAKDKKK